MEARSFHQPVANQLRFVRAVVVQDQVHIQLLRYVLLNRVEEVAKFHGTMAALGLANQRTGFGVQGLYLAFSSTHNTRARSGGARYRPTISRTVSMNSGSFDSLNVSER